MDFLDEIFATEFNYITKFRKISEARDYITLSQKQHIIIQAKPDDDDKGFFYLYDNPTSLELDKLFLQSCKFVREHVNKRFKRLFYIDIDTKQITTDIITAHWRIILPNDTPTIYNTTKGYHIVSSQYVTINEHKSLIEKLSSYLPIDKNPIHSLRLAGSKDKKGTGRKEHPINKLLYETLVQPLDAPTDFDFEDNLNDSKNDTKNEDIKAGIMALTDNSSAFEQYDITGARMTLKRLEPSMCKICDRIHDSSDAFLIIEEGAYTGRAFCFRDTKKSKVFNTTNKPFNDDILKTYPGEFNTRTSFEYEKSDGAMNPNSNDEDYIDGSPCGVGKSKTAWSSIDSNKSVLLASYRKTFSSSQGALNQCQNYQNIKGDICFSSGKNGKEKFVVQYESLKRIKGVPDVFIIDEFHGIRRQACGDLSNADSWANFVRLIKDCGRLIVLDAYIDDNDAKLLNQLRGRDIHFIRNTYKPHQNKSINVFTTRNEFNENFNNFINPYFVLIFKNYCSSYF